MKALLFFTIVFFCDFDLIAKVIYVEPVSNAKYVSIYNNIIIGFDETIENTDLNSLVTVTGSVSNLHYGEVILTHDRKKIIFKPYVPFSFNETVVVKLSHLATSSTSKNVLTYTFHTQTNRLYREHGRSFKDEFSNLPIGRESAQFGDTIMPPVLNVDISNNPSPGDLYLSNFPFAPIPYTPYLLISDNLGIFSFHRQVNDFWSLDFKKQPNGMLTYSLNGKFYQEDVYHNLIDSFECGNGYDTDNHELRILSNGHALLMSYDPQVVDMSQIVPGGDPLAVVVGLIIQELDENKNVVFQWRSWDHIAITDAEHEDLTADYVDYVHGNAIELDTDGNLLISSRHLSEITKISRTTGEIIWRLGGVQNQFTFVNDPLRFSYQHHIRRIPNGNITLFDNGNFHTPQFSRAVEYHLDEVNKIATLVWQYRNSPDIYGFAMGSMQRLKNGNSLIGWGSTNPTLTEVSPSGNIVLQMNLPANHFTYRVFRDEFNFALNMKLSIEGFYDTQSNRLRMNDTVTVFLRNINSPFAIVDSSSSIIDSVTLTGNFKFYNASSGIYYISVDHRNALETWSRQGGENFSSGQTYLYDFTSSGSKAYGNNLVLKGTKWSLYSGDVNKDGQMNLLDNILIFNDVVNFVRGYVNTDINGDNVLNLKDLLIIHNNSIQFIKAIRP